MNFYTSVDRYGNNILYRGFHNGQKVARRIKFQPTLFHNTDKPTGWTNLQGNNVKPVQFNSMRDARDFINKYEGVDNFPIYGTTNYVTQFITEYFEGEIKFDRDRINVTSIDIEVASDQGFPHADRAEHEIQLITLKNNIDNLYHVFGVGDYDPQETQLEEIDPRDIIYYKCEDEIELLPSF